MARVGTDYGTVIDGIWYLNPVTGGDTRTASVFGPEHVWDVTSTDNCTTPYFAEAQFECDREQIALWRKELGKQ